MDDEGEKRAILLSRRWMMKVKKRAILLSRRCGMKGKEGYTTEQTMWQTMMKGKRGL